MTNTMHAHVRTFAVDCDGPITRTHVETFNDDEIAEHEAAKARGGWNDFSEIHFMDRVFASKCGPYAVRAMKIEISEGRVEWDETTDEGGVTGLIEWCTDDTCATSLTSYRDHRAESMGY